MPEPHLLIDDVLSGRQPLAGKAAVVTGGAMGIGQATALILARLGASVVIADVHESGRQTEALIAGAGGKALFVPTDVSSPEAVESLRAAVHDRVGPASILINAAVVFRVRPILEHTIEEWDRIQAVNLRGSFLCIRAFLPEMLERHEGVVVTMRSSEASPFLSAYLASKGGARSLALGLASEVGSSSGVSVFCFNPPMVDTPGLRAAFPDLARCNGMTPEEFTTKVVPPEGLMSADVAATGLVGAVLNASRVHGTDVEPGAGLRYLGLGPTGARRS